MYSFILPRVESSSWHHSPRYLILDKFLEHLKDDEFNGFSEIKGKKYDFALFFLRGAPVQGFRIIEDTLYTFSTLSEKLSHFDLNELIMFPTPPAFVTGITDITRGTQIHDTQDSLKSVITNLESEKFDGSVVIQWDNTQGFIVFQHGIPENSLMVTLSTIVEGKDALENILKYTAQKQSNITVYGRKSQKKTLKSEKVLHIKENDIPVESRFGTLGKELVKAAFKKKRLLTDITDDLCVDLEEIKPIYTYMVEEGYAELKNRDVIEEKTRKFWNGL